MLLRLLTLCLLLWPITASAQQKKVWNPGIWEKEIAQFEAGDKKRMPPSEGVLFVGSSSIRLWKVERSFPDLPVINRGFGGSHLGDSLYYADRIILKYSPKSIVLYAGDNDLADGVSPEQLGREFQQLTSLIHEKLPRTHIYVIGIKPSPARWALFDKQTETNQLIARLCAQDARLHYVDIVKLMLNDAGRPRPELYKEDGLHVNDKGYALWASVLKPLLTYTP
ncbi:MAG TPA: SGNH/GDSL hydrolase family protein [Gemmatales bacterium]|nr:SGNH/GDSL hydrolase family protein [Gemmatales bacterium]